MALTTQEVYEIAREAVTKMAQENKSDHTFPFDEVWSYAPPGLEIPSTLRPSQAKKLIASKHIEPTGGMRNASSDKRASSKTPEYRFGSALVSRPVPATGTSALLKELQQAMDADGYLISPAELANFYLAMMVSPLVILSGISGTGKSLLPRLFAKYTESSFCPIAVQPQWSDNSDLLGYVPNLTPGKFVKGALIDGLRAAKGSDSKLVIALLDEMNLAPVEHYFSDFLSIAETRTRRGSAIVTDALPFELPEVPLEEYKDLKGMTLPHNLRVVGTANMDETTHSFSPKVLDRAFTIEFDDPELTAFTTATPRAGRSLAPLVAALINQSNPISVLEARGESQDLFDHIAQMLAEVQEILKPAGIKFGYRTRDAVLLYLHNWRKLELEEILPSNAALDFCLLQKVLPKISGSGGALKYALTNLALWLKKDRTGSDVDTGIGFNGPFPRSLEKIERMAALLETDGATHYWGT